MIRLALIAALLCGCSATPGSPLARETPSTKSSGVFVLPSYRLTPGAVDSKVSLKTICSQSTRARRSVSAATKAEVYARYGLPVEHGAWEIDHLVPLELGGSNAVTNLWPEPGVRPNPKDRLENRLHALVCSGQLSLFTAVEAIKTDWIAAYHRYG